MDSSPQLPISSANEILKPGISRMAKKTCNFFGMNVKGMVKPGTVWGTGEDLNNNSSLGDLSNNYPLDFCLLWNFWRNCFFLSLPFGFCYFSSNHHENCKFGRNLIFCCWNSIYFSRGIWWCLHNWSISTHKKVIQAQSWEKWGFWPKKKP